MDNIVSNEQITLVENNEIIAEDSDVAQTLNSFFSNIVTNLKISAYADSNSNLENVTDPIIKLILKYRDHPSMLTIGEVCKEKSDSPFLFTGIEKEEKLKKILNLDASKTWQDTDVPTKILKENADSFADFLHTSFNEFVKKSEFSSVLKLANITPVFKKGERECKNNYRAVSILSNVSKIFERITFRQISNYMDSFFSKYQCGFRKGYSTQQCLLSMLEK